MIERIPEPWELAERYDNELERRYQKELINKSILHKSQKVDYTFEECLSKAESFEK
jgi:hypothetical protein